MIDHNSATETTWNLYLMHDETDADLVFSGSEAECDAYRRHHPCGANEQYQAQVGADGAVTNY